MNLLIVFPYCEHQYSVLSSNVSSGQERTKLHTWQLGWRFSYEGLPTLGPPHRVAE